MANYCSNNIVFYSNNREKISDLWDKMYNFVDKAGYGSVYDFMMTYVKDKEVVSNNVDRRDYFIGVDTELEESGEDYYFKLETESA